MLIAVAVVWRASYWTQFTVAGPLFHQIDMSVRRWQIIRQSRDQLFELMRHRLTERASGDMYLVTLVLRSRESSVHR